MLRRAHLATTAVFSLSRVGHVAPLISEVKSTKLLLDLNLLCWFQLACNPPRTPHQTCVPVLCRSISQGLPRAANLLSRHPVESILRSMTRVWDGSGHWGTNQREKSMITWQPIVPMNT